MTAPAPKGYCTLHLQGGIVLLDFCDLGVVDPDRNTWTVITKANTKYATTKMLQSDGKVRNIYMHRLILRHPDNPVDHIDRNGLNNLRTNLRIVTAHQNWTNSGPRSRGKSKYKGVSPVGKRWRATIQAHRNWKQIGIFDSQEAAARAYDSEAENLFGEVAFLNRKHFTL